MVSTYTWTVCEGLYLHTLLASAYVAKRLTEDMVAGLLAPVLTAARKPKCVIFGFIQRYSSVLPDDTNKCWMNEECWARGVLVAIVVGSFVLNLIFLCNIMHVLCRKLRAAPRPPSATTLQAFREF